MADDASNTLTPRAFARYAGISGAAVLTIGVTVLAGWALDARTLQSFYPGWVTMKANTAFALALGGASLLLHASGRTDPASRAWIPRALGTVIALVGLLTCVQYVFAIDLNIDELLFSAALETPGGSTPGRMAAVTAIAFLLIGPALTLVGTRPRRGIHLAQPLSIAAGALALAAMLGYVYGAISPVGSGQGIQIATHTAVAIVLLAAGVLSLEAHAGWLPTLTSRRAGGELARRLLPIAVIVPLALGALRHLARWIGNAYIFDDAAIVAVLTMLAFAAVIWRTAYAVNDADAQWLAGEQERLTLIARADASIEIAAVERAARESAETLLREKDEALTLLDLVLESTPTGFAFFDRDLSLRRANAAFMKMFELESDRCIGLHVRDVAPTQPEVIEAEFRQVLATGVPIVNAPRTIKTPTGKRRHWLSSKYRLHASDGEVMGAGVTLVETTDHRELEEQLQQSQKMEAVGLLAGGVAHDFNNVLTAIRSFSELVAVELPEGSPIRGDVQEITAAADRAAALTRHLLAFSRRQILQPVVVDPNAIVEGVARLLARLIGPDIRCETVFAPDIARVLVDPGQLEQVVINLAVNARDAMPNGGTLTLETANVLIDAPHANRLSGVEEAQPGAYVLLTVSDTGIGMDHATQSRIFEPFFTTKDLGKGTGLGLSTVYGIVRQSGGHVSVYSEVGRGTTFRIYLPRTAGEVAIPAPIAEPTPPPNGGETILLVDDDEAVRIVATRILTRAGFTVLSAASPGEAMTVWDHHPGEIHLLITDLMMPDMGGGELARGLLRSRPGTRVLFTSGYTNETVIRRGLIASGMPFLAKPFTIAEVVSKVREALQTCPRGDAA